MQRLEGIEYYMKVSIVGASGYSGLELIRLLQNHPHFKVQSLLTSSKAGRNVSEEYPHLMHIQHQFEEIHLEKIAEECDVVFLATPSGVSSELAPQLMKLGLKVIDLSGDLRLKNSDFYKKWYKKKPAPEAVLKEAVYGLSEWNKERIQKATIIANPGCYPTATLLGLAPLIRNGYCDGSDIIVDAKSGVSGAGRSASLATSYSEVNENFKIYKVHEHQHIPEIEQQLEEWTAGIEPIEFSTHLVPMTRGIMATIYIKPKNPVTTKELHELYTSSYEEKHFVRVQPINQYPCTKQVYGSNYCDIGVGYNERTNKITIVSVIDNLMKGAAGQAVQNANLLFGLEETEGLMGVPLYP